METPAPPREFVLKFRPNARYEWAVVCRGTPAELERAMEAHARQRRHADYYVERVTEDTHGPAAPDHREAAGEGVRG